MWDHPPHIHTCTQAGETFPEGRILSTSRHQGYGLVLPMTSIRGSSEKEHVLNPTSG